MFAAALAQGVSFKDAAGACRIDPATARKWRIDGRKNPRGPHGEFARLLEGALETAIVQAAAEAKRIDPKWWLARMRPKHFGDPTKKIEVDATVKGEQKFVVVLPALKDDA